MVRTLRDRFGIWQIGRQSETSPATEARVGDQPGGDSHDDIGVCELSPPPVGGKELYELCLGIQLHGGRARFGFEIMVQFGYGGVSFSRPPGTSVGISYLG